MSVRDVLGRLRESVSAMKAKSGSLWQSSLSSYVNGRDDMIRAVLALIDAELRALDTGAETDAHGRLQRAQAISARLCSGPAPRQPPTSGRQSMGIVESISATGFPKQGKYLGMRTDVCFHYDTSRLVGGAVVRDDNAPPYLTIIRLDDGRHVLATECQYSVPRAAAPEGTQPAADEREVTS